jgi:hypothetical protein
MLKYIFLTFFCFTSILAFSQEKSFRCFECDNNVNLKISVEYVDETPVSLKYKGQNSSILLKKIKGSLKFQKKGYSSFTESYIEIVNGKPNGKYNFTHSGNWDYIQYIRKDGKKFDFTVNLDDSIDPNGDGYRLTPCY